VPPTSSKLVNSKCRRASIPKQQEDVTLKNHVANICFRGTLQVCRIGVAKVDRDVVKVDQDVAMAMHVSFKCMF
jgi:hypothetical protein